MSLEPYKYGGIPEKLQSWFDRLANDINLPGWQTPTLQNAWANATGYQVARYRKDLLGNTEIQGRIDSGTAAAGTLLFTLAVGYRPKELMGFVVHSNGAAGLVQIASNGQVKIQVGSNVSLDLSGIRFSTY